ncbi:MAG: hypothetical protein J6V01_07595, partial [Clostridia bacterium]|nr:hypothetical protein [Clostridia bacterium]
MSGQFDTAVPAGAEGGKNHIKLLKRLCEISGPTGSEERVREKIERRLRASGFEPQGDRCGNLILKIPGSGDGYDAENPVRVMVSAHMDEVGVIINDITGEGYLKFACLGGIDPRVLCGRTVVISGKDGDVKGVISAKAVHHLSRDERSKTTQLSSMYIDIGAASADDAKKYVSVGDSGTFDSEFILFGENDAYIKSKAIDDRLGCAVIILTAEKLMREKTELPFDLYCCFTVREEIGKTGARMVASAIDPDHAVILESTAIGDLPDVDQNCRVASVGSGGVISLLDRLTIYDRDMVDGCLRIAGDAGIPVQVKKYVSGGNDAGSVHKTGPGVRCLAISAPVRYLHASCSVAAVSDYRAM